MCEVQNPKRFITKNAFSLNLNFTRIEILGFKTNLEVSVPVPAHTFCRRYKVDILIEIYCNSDDNFEKMDMPDVE